MTGISRYAAGIVLLVLLGSTFALSQEEGETPPFDVGVWLRRADHADFPWSVSLSAPVLTLQQRFQVQVGASISLRHLKYIGLRREFHFVVKVAAANGLWIPEYSYTVVPVEEGTDPANSIYYHSSVYLRPGRYIIALIVYDAIHQRGNVWRKEINFRRLTKDPLPALDKNMPDVEFIRDGPGRRVRPLERNKEWLPVKNSRCLCIDVIANLSTPGKAVAGRQGNPRGGGKSQAPAVDYGRNASNILAASSVLSHLEVRKGRVKVSILDALRMETFYEREDARSFDWRDAAEMLSKQNPAWISAKVLRSQSMASSFLYDAFQRIQDEKSCTGEAGLPIKIIIVIGSEVEFPDRTIARQFVPPDPEFTKVYYFCFRSGDYDDVFKMLRPAKPLRSYIDDALTFRKTLADLISGLEEL
jgi:hypothetical protein